MCNQPIFYRNGLDMVYWGWQSDVVGQMVLPPEIPTRRRFIQGQVNAKGAKEVKDAKKNKKINHEEHEEHEEEREYKITKEQLEQLVPCVKKLHEVTEKNCVAKINSFA